MTVLEINKVLILSDKGYLIIFVHFKTSNISFFKKKKKIFQSSCFAAAQEHFLASFWVIWHWVRSAKLFGNLVPKLEDVGKRKITQYVIYFIKLTFSEVIGTDFSN